MNGAERRDRIRRRLDERSAAAPRAELAALLSSLSADTGLELDLQPPPTSGQSELAGRMSEQFSRTPEMSLPDALHVVADIVSNVAPSSPGSSSRVVLRRSA